MRNNEGLTRTYKRFHDRFETRPEIAKLRAIHSAMDRAVIEAYGWADLETTCHYLTDGQDEDETRQCYGWHQSVRDEIMVRLLELNTKRADRRDCIDSSSHRR